MEQIKELVSKLTLEEKAALCTGVDSWHTVAIDRLGIPAVRMSDGPHGLRYEQREEGKPVSTAQTVSFPAECALASSFDREVIKSVGEEIGEECQAFGVNVILGPGVNIKRSPLCGRDFEYLSEDPYLAGEMGTAYVKGVQSRGVGTSVKHYLANSQETRRMTSSSEVDERTLREIYMPAFEKVVKAAKPWTIMASYNKINGTYATENRKFMTDILRDEWGFDGVVVSDWGAVHSRTKAVAAGTDLAMPGEQNTNESLIQAVKSGMMPEFLLDKACEHVIALALKAGEGRRDAEMDYERGHEISVKAAQESAVLLKNEDGILPLKKSARIAFIGEFAKVPRYQGGGSSKVEVRSAPGALEAAGLSGDSRAGQIAYYQGYHGTEPDQELIDEAVKGAQTADVAVVFAGLPLSMETEGIDRTSLQMPKSHNELIEKIAGVQSNVVVVLYNGSPLEMPWLDRVKGVLEMYLGGEGAGEATVNLLFGDANPSGRLAETFPKKLSDTPSYLSYFGGKYRVNYDEKIYVGYRYYETKEMDVLFPFGYGLSYTSFAYSNLTVDKSTLKSGEELRVSVDVTNVGERFGKEVVQLYVAVKECEVLRPVKELRGFDKVALEPGETRTVTFTLGSGAFAYWNDDVHKFHVADGTFEIQIGASAHDVICREEIKVEGEELDLKMVYDMTSLVGDMMKKTVGAKFMEEHEDALLEGIIASGIAGHVMDEKPTKEMMKGQNAAEGLALQPIQTLKMFLPGVTETEWNLLIEALNRQEE